MNMALSGVRILGATRLLAGPYATMLLADMGAEVITIELPGVGDENRKANPVVNGVIGTCWLASNRNKKSLGIDLATREGQEIFKDLAKISDIVIENNRPGTMDKWNLGYEDLKKINPGIIMASISGFGQYGPYGNRVGNDICGQAGGGLMAITGELDGPPLRAGNAMADFIGGYNAVYAVLTALYYKEKTGKGQYIDIALTDGIMSVLENLMPNYDLLGWVPKREGSRLLGFSPWNSFLAKDGFVVIGATSDHLWIRLRNVMGRQDLADDPLFATTQLRRQNADNTERVVQEWVSGLTVDEVVEALVEAGVPCSRVQDAASLATDLQVQAREMLVEMEYPGVGKYRVNGIVPKLSLTPGQVYAPAPTLGQHTEEILKGLLNYSDEKLKELDEKSVTSLRKKK